MFFFWKFQIILIHLLPFPPSPLSPFPVLQDYAAGSACWAYSTNVISLTSLFRADDEGVSDPEVLLMVIRSWMRGLQDGRAMAQCEMGCAYEDGGFGVGKDQKKAVELFQRAATHGYPKAQFRYGLALLLGLGIAQDTDGAFFWIHGAAAGGCKEAQLRLGLLLAKGAHGIKADPLAAEKWLRKVKDEQQAQAPLEALLVEQCQESYRRGYNRFTAVAREGTKHRLKFLIDRAIEDTTFAATQSPWPNSSEANVSNLLLGDISLIIGNSPTGYYAIAATANFAAAQLSYGCWCVGGCVGGEYLFISY